MQEKVFYSWIWLVTLTDYLLLMTGKTVIISSQPYFYKKAELFPGSVFVIGADTAVRLINVCIPNSLTCTSVNPFVVWHAFRFFFFHDNLQEMQPDTIYVRLWDPIRWQSWTSSSMHKKYDIMEITIHVCRKIRKFDKFQFSFLGTK